MQKSRVSAGNRFRSALAVRQVGMSDELDLMGPAIGVVTACMAGEYEQAGAIAMTVDIQELVIALAGFCGGLLEAYEEATGADRWAILQECALPD